MKPNPVETGRRIKQLRLSCGLTMEELGRRLENSPRATVSNWERGTNLPNPQKLKKLAEIGDTSIDWIKWGSLEDYISAYLIDSGYQYFITDFPETPHVVYMKLADDYLDTISIDKGYEMCNQAIENTFSEFYFPKFQNYIKNLLKSEIDPILNNYAEKNHSNSRDRFNTRFKNNFYDDLRYEKIKYGETDKIINLAKKLLEKMDSAYESKFTFSSAEDFLYQKTSTPIETEEFLLELSEKFNFPYKKNSSIAKFLTDNHDNFKK